VVVSDMFINWTRWKFMFINTLVKVPTCIANIAWRTQATFKLIYVCLFIYSSYECYAYLSLRIWISLFQNWKSLICFRLYICSDKNLIRCLFCMHISWYCVCYPSAFFPFWSCVCAFLFSFSFFLFFFFFFFPSLFFSFSLFSVFLFWQTDSRSVFSFVIIKADGFG